RPRAFPIKSREFPRQFDRHPVDRVPGLPGRAVRGAALLGGLSETASSDARNSNSPLHDTFPVLRMFDPNALDADFGRPTATVFVASAKDGVIAMAASR